MPQVKSNDNLYFKIILGLILLRPSLDILTNWNFQMYGNLPHVNINQLLGILVFGLAGMYLILRLTWLFRTPLFYVIAIFLLLSFISIFYSVNYQVSAVELIRLATIFLLYFLAYQLTSNISDFRLIVKVILISYIVPAIFALYQLVFGLGLPDDFGGFQRIYGTFAHPNPFAFYTILILALVVVLALSNKKQPVNTYWILAAILFFFLLSSYSRSALFAFLLFLFFLGAFKYRRLLIVAFVLFLGAYFLMPQFQQRFWELITLDPYGSVVWRFRLWQDMLPVAFWHPYFGHGLGTFNEMVEYLRGYRFGSMDAHNDYLKIFTELGLAGLILYLLIIGGLLKNLYQIFKKAATQYKTLALGLLVIVLAIYGVSAFDNILVATALQWNLWILLGSWLKIGALKN